ncbi:LuxR C-terminal-related transcriptional regulator [Kitasatospora sp. NPDC058032]|uniref:LuxR C-terminal-related transcriptional regulator n=1 Tax=Kitasatospora sp. NPDC058032 TaxID=3346307 RepID=UPI0036D9E096
MTRPPTAEHPGNQPASATQRRSGKGRRAKAAPTAPTAPTSGNGAGKDEAAAGLLRRLTAREAQAFAHLAAGRDLAETAAALGVTPTTARSYQHRALRKLGTRTQEEITALAALLPTPDAAPAPGRSPKPGGGKPRRGPKPDRTRTTATTPPTPHRADDRPPRPESPGGDTGKGAPADSTDHGRNTTEATSARQADNRQTPADHVDASPADRQHTNQTRHITETPPPLQGGDGQTPTDHVDTFLTDRQQRPTRAEAAAPLDTRAPHPVADATDTNRPQGVRAGRAAAQAGRNAGRSAAEQAVAADVDDLRAGEGQPASSAGPPTAGGRAVEAGGGWAADAGQAGSRAAAMEAAGGRAEWVAAVGFEEVYAAAHTRLVQQVFLLTACKYRAVRCVGRAFDEARRRWAEVVAGGEPEAWVRARAFESALSPWHRGGPRRAHAWRLPHRRIKVRPADEAQAVLPDHDRLTDRDRALLKALRRLSRPQRRALVLHDGLGMPATAVAVEVESTVTAAEARVWAARVALAHWVPELVGPDPAADGFADRLCELMHRAAVRGAPEPPRPPVPLLRARHGLANAGRTGAAALLTAAVGGAVLATLAGGGPGELFRLPDPPPPSLCAAVPTSASDPDAPLPLVPDGPPSGIQSLWCSPTPGLEPVVLDPPPPREDGPYRPPAGGRAAEALPPPGVVAAEPPRGCAPWALHQCAPIR